MYQKTSWITPVPGVDPMTNNLMHTVELSNNLNIKRLMYIKMTTIRVISKKISYCI